MLPVIGQKATMRRHFRQCEVNLFAELSHDDNPVHTDPEYAQESIFGGPIVHGVFVASMFSALLGKSLPGEGSIYLNQDLQFRAPVYPGDAVEAEVEVMEVQPHKRGHLVKLATRATVRHHAEAPRLAVEGEATVLLPAAA